MRASRIRLRRALTASLIAVGLASCGGSDAPPAIAPPSGAPTAHVHGLGIDPADDSLLIATHSGLLRAAADESRATRVGKSRQDTMGFTVVGPRRYLGSGHPDPRSAREPPRLGLIESRDAGRSWKPVALSGQVDLHILRTAGDRVYGFDSSSGRLVVSRDRGRTFAAGQPPGEMIDLLVDPRDDRRLLAATPEGIFESRDGGADWRAMNGRAGLLARPSGSKLVLIEADGATLRSRDGGRTWSSTGSLGAAPVALVADGATLYAALESGAVMRSDDGGRTWRTRVEPTS